MRYLKKFKTEDEMAKFFNSSKYKKGLPFVAKLGELNNVTFFEKDSLKLKYKMTEDMSEYLDEYKNALAVAGYDNNKMLLTNNGNIYDSFIVNGVEQALPLSEIKHTNFGPIYEENKSTTKNGKIIYCVNGLNSDVNATFETPFDIENGYLWMWIYSKTLNQFIDFFGDPIKNVPSEELEAMMNVTSDSVQLKKDFIDMVYSDFGAEDIESYGMEMGYSFINEMPNWDGDINEETENYVSNNAITCSYTYTYSGSNIEEVSFNDKNIIKDFSITFERPLAETDVFIAPSSDEPLPALLEFSLMMDTEDNQHFTPTPMFTEKIRTYGISFFDIRDTNDNYVTYQMSYREGGVPQVIYGDLETGEYNIEATISPEFYVYNYRPTSIEETNEIYNGYMVKNILPIGRIFLGTGGYSNQLNLGLFINEIVIPNGFVLMPEYLNSSPYLEKITIPDSVTSIDSYALCYCTKLTSVTIPDSVTSIGGCAFQNCDSLTSVIIGNGVTSIGSYAFQNCKSLTEITIPDGVTSISNGAFHGCSNLTEITIPDNVTSIGGDVFDNCGSLTSVTIGNGVTSIGNYTFYACTKLTSVTIPDSVTSIGDSAFKNCTSLSEITIPDSVTSIGNKAFSNCSGLTSIEIPNSVTSIDDYAFSGCSGLTEVTIGNSVTSIGEDAFQDCSGLTRININCDSIGSWFEGNTSIKEVVIGDSVESIGRDAFSGCTNLDSIVIPDSVTTIGNNAFYECQSLSEITIPDSVTSIGNDAFRNCFGLTSVAIGNGVTSIGNNAFMYCSRLTSVTIPDSVTTIGDYAFGSCRGLTSVAIGNGVTSIGNNAFWSCDDLTSVAIGNGVTSIGASAFSGCTNLDSIVIPDSVTTIGERAFGNCYALTSVTIPDSVTTIGKYAFKYCRGLTSVAIGNGVTNIGVCAFQNCESLTSVAIGNGVTNIGGNTFYYCESLTEITCLATTAPSVTSNVFTNLPSNGVLKVPNSSDYSTWLSNLPSGWTIQYI